MRAKIAGAAAALVVLFAMVYWFAGRFGEDEEARADSKTAFALVDAADRGFDGSPALALTFSLPLDSRTSYDKYIRVFEMPGTGNRQETSDSDDDMDEAHQATDKASLVSTSPQDTDTTNGKVVSGAWVVGENPRLLYFPHIKPQSRYVVHVQAGLPAKNGKTLAEESRYSIVSAPVSPAYYFASNGMVLPAKQNGGLPVVTVNVPEVDVQFLRVKADQLPAFLDRVISGRKPANSE